MRDQPIRLTIYGDFNCPFCALASARAARLQQLGLATVDWRAVEHAPDIPVDGNAVAGDLNAELLDELDRIRDLLGPTERLDLRLPAVQPNTHLATTGFAGSPTSTRSELRTSIFEAFWRDGLDIGSQSILNSLGAPASDEDLAQRWREEWLGLTKPIVPVMVLPDRYVSRGLGALARLATFTDTPTDTTTPIIGATPPAVADNPAELGGEAPCSAHLFADDY